MDTVSAESFLLDQMPLAARSLIPATLKTAYAAVKLMVDQEPILQVASAIDGRGRLISWAVDHAFERAILTRQWPFEYEWKDWAHPTGRYLAIRLPHSILSISQIASSKKQPRNVVFRENARLNNAPCFDFEQFVEERKVKGLPHFLMIHGYQNLNFAHLAVPHAVHGQGWIHKSSNLMKMPHTVAQEVPAVESTEFEETMVLKGEIEKWRRDNGA